MRSLEFSSQINNYKATLQLKAGKVLPLANPCTSYNRYLHVALLLPVQLSQCFQKGSCAQESLRSSLCQAAPTCSLNKNQRQGRHILDKQIWNNGQRNQSHLLVHSPVSAHSTRESAAQLSAWKKLQKQLLERFQLYQGHAWRENLGTLGSKMPGSTCKEHMDSPPDCRARNEKATKINHTGEVVKEVEEIKPNNQLI